MEHCLTSAVMGCTYAGYSSTNYSSNNSIVASDSGTFADATTMRDLVASVAVADVAKTVADGSDVGGEAYSTDSNSAIQGAPATMLLGFEPSYGVVDDMENITGSTNISAGSSQVVGADFSVNENDVIEANYVHGFSTYHQLVDGSVISLFQVCNRCFCLGWCEGIKQCCLLISSAIPLRYWQGKEPF